jgi:hypothetical protein
MARPVQPWLWAVLLRDFGPRNSSVRLVMHTLRSFMNNDGYTNVGQEKLAAAACLSKPTMRKALNLAWEAQWIGVALYRRGGQEWRSYEYRCCIPDELQVPDVHEELVMTWAEMHEQVDTETHPEMTRKVGNGLSHVDGKNGSWDPEGGKNGPTELGKSEAKVGKISTEGGKIDAPKVGKPLSPKCISEKSSVSSHQKVSPEEGRALPRPTALGVDSDLKKTGGRSETAPTLKQVRKGNAPYIELPKEQREKAAAEIIAKVPSQASSWIAREFGLTIDEVEQLRCRVSESNGALH